MRLFIATPINDEVVRELARIIANFKNAGAPVKWVEPSNIHLTLKFLGETDEKQIPRLKEIINNVASAHSVISTSLNSLGAFPNLNRARVYWVDLRGGESKLTQMAAGLDRAIHELGIEKETRPFRAHLTLGRVKFPQGLQKLNETVKSLKVNPLQQLFDRIVLFKSTLTPRGSIYENLHEARLSSDAVD